MRTQIVEFWTHTAILPVDGTMDEIAENYLAGKYDDALANPNYTAYHHTVIQIVDDDNRIVQEMTYDY